MAGPWRRPASDFSEKNDASQIWYDQDDDWNLIVSSFAEQYGVRLEIEDIAWPEYCKLFSGFSAETALGRIVTIRSEKDSKVVKGFSPEQKRIRRDWMNRRQENNQALAEKQLNSMHTIFKAMFGGKETKK